MVSNQNAVTHGWAAPGTYAVRLLAQFVPSGATASSTTVVYVVQPDYYVNASNVSPAFPYTNWATAATNIQDAVDAGTVPGRRVFVTNGLYQYGGRALYGIMTNRVVLTNGVRLQSVNGPKTTLICGSAAPTGDTGDGAVRCVYADHLSVIDGFSLTNGHTLNGTSVTTELFDGGGIWCEPGATITNCLVTGNSAAYYGGGVNQGNVYNSVLAFNSGYYGGGAGRSLLVNCLIASNSASWGQGGGAMSSTLSNCTVVGNYAPWWTPSGGVGYSSVYNSILYYNTSGNVGGTSSCVYSCATPLPSGPGNITSEPLFLDPASGDFHLQSNSPCINAGNPSVVPANLDLDGVPRVTGGTVDIGAYEFQAATSLISHDWLRYYGLPMDGSADFLDSDSDGQNNWQEWLAGTAPNDASSRLRVAIGATGHSGVTLSWPSSSTRNYFLQVSTNLAAHPAFLTLATNIIGQAGATIFADTNLPGTLPRFYRVGVQTW